MNNKKSFFMLAVGLTASAAITVVAMNNNILAKNTYASGIVEEGINRTLTINNALSIDGEGNGTLAVGNISVFAKNCSAAGSGVAKVGNDGFIIYCNDAALYNSESYQGFGSSTIVSMAFELNNNRTGEVTVAWGKLDTENNITFNGSGSKYAINFTTTPEEKDITITKSDTGFIAYQSGSKTSGNSCIYIGSKTTGLTFDIVSLTVEYTCS